jgi:hypothetical protein
MRPPLRLILASCGAVVLTGVAGLANPVAALTPDNRCRHRPGARWLPVVTYTAGLNAGAIPGVITTGADDNLWFSEVRKRRVPGLHG